MYLELKFENLSPLKILWFCWKKDEDGLLFERD